MSGEALLEAILNDPDRPALELRAGGLLALHEKEWVDPFGGWVEDHRFERGFLSAVCINDVTS